jgi:shikimate dehydrogenase
MESEQGDLKNALERLADNPAPRAAVIGWPVEHSRSPLIHTSWLKRYGLNGSYDRLAVPIDKAEETFRNFPETRLIGANVTIPFKEVAFQACDVVDEIGKTLKAVNTVWLENGQLHGTNTDMYGFLANLDDQSPGWDERKRHAVIIGAGGAARACVYGMIQRGFQIVSVINRTLERGEELSADFGDSVKAFGFEDLALRLKNADILVNTTSLGMHGQPPLQVPLTSAPGHMVVCDIVYVPLKTPLLRDARMQGFRTVDGLGMLLHQAVPGFELWYGVRPQVDTRLRGLVLKDLGLKS